MISYHNGDILESNCEMICHQVNLQGVMGGGLALQIAAKYPSVEWQYKQNYGLFLCGMGKVLFSKTDSGLFVANCFSQDKSFNTIYSAVKGCFRNVLKFCQKHNLKVVGVPYNYGCGIAKGDFTIVENIVNEIFKEEPIDLQWWKYN